MDRWSHDVIDLLFDVGTGPSRYPTLLSLQTSIRGQSALIVTCKEVTKRRTVRNMIREGYLVKLRVSSGSFLRSDYRGKLSTIVTPGLNLTVGFSFSLSCLGHSLSPSNGSVGLESGK